MCQGLGVREHWLSKRQIYSQGSRCLLTMMTDSWICTPHTACPLPSMPALGLWTFDLVSQTQKQAKPLLMFFSPIFLLSQVKHLTTQYVHLITPHEFPRGMLPDDTPASKNPQSSRARAGIPDGEGCGGWGQISKWEEVRDDGQSSEQWEVWGSQVADMWSLPGRLPWASWESAKLTEA